MPEEYTSGFFIWEDIMRKAFKRVSSVFASFMMVLLLALYFVPSTVMAAGEKVSFGSDFYEPEKKGTFRVGVYIESSENMGNYEVYLSYDPTKLEYVSGATSSGDGTIAITETCNDTNKKYLLTFKPLMACSTYLKVDNATIYDKATGTPTIVEELPYVNIFVGGDTSTALTQLSVNGSEVEGLTGRVFDYTVIVPYADEMEISSWDDVTLEPSISNLQEGINDLELKVTSTDGSITMYNLTVDMGPAPIIEEPVVEEVTTQEAVEEATEELTEDETNEKTPLFEGDRLKLAIVALILLILLILAATVLIIVTNRALNIRAKRERMLLKTKIEAAKLGIEVDIDIDDYDDEDDEYDEDLDDDEDYDEDEIEDEDDEDDEEEVDE